MYKHQNSQKHLLSIKVFLVLITLIISPFRILGQPVPEDLYFSTLDQRIPRGFGRMFEDSRGYLWFVTRGGLCRYDGSNMEIFEPDHNDPNSLSTSQTISMAEDPQGKLWISTYLGLNSYDPLSGTYQHFFTDEKDPSSISNNQPQQLASDEDGFLWIGFNDDLGLNRFDTQTGKSTRFKVRKGVLGHLQGRVTGDILADGHRIYLCTSAGFEYFDKTTGQFRFFPLLDEKGDTIFYQPRGLCKSQDGTIWVNQPTEGLRRYHPDTDTVSSFKLPVTETSPHAAIRDLAEAKNGLLWLSNEQGLWSLSSDRKELNRHRVKIIDSGLVPQANGPLYVDRFGMLWLRQYFYDPRRSLFEYHQLEDPASGEPAFVASLFEVNDSIAIVHLYSGYYSYNMQTREYKLMEFPEEIPIGESDFDPIDPDWHRVRKGGLHFYHAEKKQFAAARIKIGEQYVSSPTLFDQNENMWIASWGFGLIRVKREVWKNAMGPITEFDQWLPDDPPPALPTKYFLGMDIDSDNQIWLACRAGGLVRMDPTSGEIEQFDLKEGNSVSDTYIFNVIEGQDGLLWITTNSGGLNKYDKKTGKFTIYNRQNGMLDTDMFVIDLDRDGHVWMNTATGIMQLNPSTEEFTYYNQADGVMAWKNNGFISKKTNRLFWSGLTGFVVAHVDSLKNRPTRASELAIKSIRTSDPTSERLQAINAQEWKDRALELSPQQNSIDIQFAILDFRNPIKHQYQYALSQDNKPDWIDLGTEAQVRLSQLAPGTYFFHLRGRNSDYIWTQLAQPLKIIIHPPFWQTGWAYLMYALLIGGSIYFFYHISLSRKIARTEAQQVKALEELRSRFYTNITHEFRTPLTVILGMTEETTNVSKSMNLIRRNGKKLLHLINQMLDLSKLETGSMLIHFKQVEIISFTKYLCQSFHSLAEKKHIHLRIETEMNELWMDMDEEKYRQIVSNLLSNAIKFTRENGQILVQLEKTGKFFILKVKDDGIGIKEEHLPHIFNRFYQADKKSIQEGNGTGIGLALTKELMKLLESRIKVTSKLGKGTTFTLQFPIHHLSEELHNYTPTSSKAQQTDETVFTEGPNGHSSLPSLLLIEDNQDLIQYINTLLHNKYQLHIAKNGALGIQQAIEIIPDIIISDVMMPEKNGFEVVQTLKSDERTSHIPVILLTARSTQEDRIAGLKRGADAYLKKPFDKEELFVRLEQLLELRKKLQRYYSKNLHQVKSFAQNKEEGAANPSLDDLFMDKIRQVIEEKIDDPHLDLDYLCKAVHLSSTQLFRKMKALTGEPPIRFIRKVRLYKAKELLKNSDLSISEISYETGFNDPHYFSRAFSKEFGCAPSSIRKE